VGEGRNWLVGEPAIKLRLVLGEKNPVPGLVPGLVVLLISFARLNYLKF